MEKSFYLSRSKSRGRSNPNEKSLNIKEKPQTAQKKKRLDFQNIKEQNNIKFPAYLADCFFMDKGTLLKFNNLNNNNINNSSFYDKIPLKINNYGLADQNLEKIPKIEKKTENNEIYKNIEKTPKTQKNQENHEIYKNIEYMPPNSQNPRFSTYNNINDKMKSNENIDKNERRPSKKVEKLTENTEKRPSKKTLTEKSPQNIESLNEFKDIKKIDEKIQKTNEKSNKSLNKVENITEIPKNDDKSQKSTKNSINQIENSDKIKENKPIVETFVINYKEEEYTEEKFDSDSNRNLKENNEIYVKTQDFTEEIIENNKVHQDTPIAIKEKIDEIQENHDNFKENLENIKETISEEKPKKAKTKKNRSEAVELKPGIAGNDSILSPESPKKHRKNHTDLSASSLVNNSSSPKKLYEYSVDFEKNEQIIKNNEKVGKLSKPEKFSKQEKQEIIEKPSKYDKLSSPTVVSYENLSEIKKKPKTIELLNKSRELSPLSVSRNDISANSLKESPSKLPTKLQPLREMTKNNDTSLEFIRKQAKLMPLKGSPLDRPLERPMGNSLERPITQEGNNRKKIEQKSNKKMENLQFESEKYCSLNIPIKKSVKKVIYFTFT